VVHTGSAARRPIASASRFSAARHRLPDPLERPDAFAESVLAIAESESIRVVLPVTDQSIQAILARPQSGSAILPLPSAAAFHRASDKLAVSRLAESVGLRSPAQLVLEEPAASLPAQLRFPLVGKPSRSVVPGPGGRLRLNVFHAAGREELVERLASLPRSAYPVLLQERILGPGVGVFLLRWDGRTLASFAHQRLREKPPAGGVSVYSEGVNPPAGIVAGAEALLAALEWRGVAMVEFKVHEPTGIPYLMEVNGRFWGSLQLAIDSGVDFPALLVEAALGRSVQPVHQYSSGRRLRWCLGDLDHLLTRLRHDAASLGLPPDAPSRGQVAAAILLPWRSPGRWETLRWSDPRPGLVEAFNWVADL
jgi:predicted ATP-grasp superfamily ATP-dependent carboligase